MTKEGLKTSIKGFAMDLIGIRKNEQEKTAINTGYQVAKIAFDKLADEVRKNPFKSKYEVDLYDEIEKCDLDKIVELITHRTDEINSELNKSINVEGIRRISLGLAFNDVTSVLGIKVRVYFD